MAKRSDFLALRGVYFLSLVFSLAAFSGCARVYAQSPTKAVPHPIAGPLTVSANARYFQDSRGTALTLNGSQTWNTLQDWGIGGRPQPLDFDAFVQFLLAHGQNFTLLWTVAALLFSGARWWRKSLLVILWLDENSKFCGPSLTPKTV